MQCLAGYRGHGENTELSGCHHKRFRIAHSRDLGFIGFGGSV